MYISKLFHKIDRNLLIKLFSSLSYSGSGDYPAENVVIVVMVNRNAALVECRAIRALPYLFMATLFDSTIHTRFAGKQIS